ncbi:MAG: hypothetical protein KME15_22445 [Drouetiella hepatica Uher 2000/2452]|jgi:transposase|uniref:Uncharacterized protein n=1 Tax=Drouetiella hepatica Uher 2000/2452 TaxID=904376 RepID=A0A951QGK4_9CYAN|nr:hypothetical protein [Drouetiella hepatica Uher 2000/2452]
MSLHSEAIPAIPEETVRIARAAFSRGNLYMRMWDELGTFYQDEDLLTSIPGEDNWQKCEMSIT